MLNSILIVIIYLFIQMCVVWLFYRIFKNPSIVDGAWSVGLMVSGLIYMNSMIASLRTAIIVSLLVLWALRLAGYLWITRISKGHVDKRYSDISSQWKISQELGFFLNFQLQGLLILLISSIFLLISRSTNLTITAVDICAFTIILIGIFGETTADLQLHQFKRTNPGKVCNIGYWNYSRHPNYFFDWLTWAGFTLIAFQSEYGYLSLIPLLLLYVIFTRITGPITEQGSIKSRGQKYIVYQQSTSMFFPWFKKKIDSEKR